MRKMGEFSDLYQLETGLDRVIFDKRLYLSDKSFHTMPENYF